MNYSEQLKDPRWRKKRRQMIVRSSGKCELCGHGNINQLQVHHREYKNGLRAWEYELKDLITLCRNCHYTVYKPHLREKKMNNTRICNILNNLV